ncbi:MAG: restriction endonuclease subunit S [Desulfotignum sp.]|nr:restriction endonuclease subunit S [Desulfobacteraceae bacterium]
MKWQEMQLGSFLTLKRGYDLPSSKRSEGMIPVISSSGITGCHSVAKVEGPGVVTGRYGTLGEVFFVQDDFWPLNTALYVQDFKGNDPRFSAYFLKSILAGTLSDKAAVPGINRNDLHARKIVVSTDIGHQKTIAAIISAYDDLIENNRRRIQLLEESARLLFREWFVYLRFPGHEHVRMINGVPDEWEKVPLGDIAPFKYGKALKKDDRLPGPVPVFGSSGIVGYHEKALVSGPTIIVGRKGNVGSIYWSFEDCHPIDTVFYIDACNCSLYLYYSLQQVAFISTDVAVPGLNRDFAHSRRVVFPEIKLRRLFEEKVAKCHQQINVLQELIGKLESARNLLLPRLMNGEIPV